MFIWSSTSSELVPRAKNEPALRGCNTVLAEKHEISALISMKGWSAGPETEPQLGEEKGKSILCQVMTPDSW